MCVKVDPTRSGAGVFTPGGRAKMRRRGVRSGDRKSWVSRAVAQAMVLVGVLALHASAGTTTTYTYDALGRVTSVTYSGSGAYVSYSYDAAGNRTQLVN